MKFLKMVWFVPCLLLILSACQNQQEKSSEETEIRNTAEAYAKAFNQHDAKAIANLWSENAVYVNPETGAQVKGRDAIKREFEEEFKQFQNATLTLNIAKITFPKEGQAVEQGLATVSIPGKEESNSTYRVDYVKMNGKWLIARTSEEDILAPPTHFENLKNLGWLIGTWVDKDLDSKVISDYKWDQNKNYIIQKFTVSIHERPEMDGEQIIGWDPVKKQIRSWVFDSNGGFGDGKWHQENESWVVNSTYTTASGARGSATHIFKPLSENSFSWESIDREMNGELLPNIPPVKLLRKEG